MFQKLLFGSSGSSGKYIAGIATRKVEGIIEIVYWECEEEAFLVCKVVRNLYLPF